MAPLVRAFGADPYFDSAVCVTAQHRQMLDQVLMIFDIKPDFDLNVMKPGQDLYDVSSAVLLGLRGILKTVKPDCILVHGDTTTALAASMAGFYAGVPVAHVEAGLRTFDLSAPFPEEFNRQVVSKIAQWHFAPTDRSRDNLLQEGIDPSRIAVTGNTVIDALFSVLEKIRSERSRKEYIAKFLRSVLGFDFESIKFVLITGHRRENFGEGFLSICRAIRELAKRFPDVHFVYPVHLNPDVKNPVHEVLGRIPNVHLIAPLDYESFVYLLSTCHLVLTDSGGIQEEAPSFGKPVLVMRDVTERPESIDAGTARLVGADESKIVENVTKLLNDENAYAVMSGAKNPYGDGKACARILEFMKAQ